MSGCELAFCSTVDGTSNSRQVRGKISISNQYVNHCLQFVVYLQSLGLRWK